MKKGPATGRPSLRPAARASQPQRKPLQPKSKPAGPTTRPAAQPKVVKTRSKPSQPKEIPSTVAETPKTAKADAPKKSLAFIPMTKAEDETRDTHVVKQMEVVRLTRADW